MKDADFKNLIQGIRKAGAYLHGTKIADAQVDSLIGPLSKRRAMVTVAKMNRGAKAAIARAGSKGLTAGKTKVRRKL